jgi:hypothetical protein
MNYTSKGAQALQAITAKATTEPGAKWTPETAWTDAALKARAEYAQRNRHMERQHPTEGQIEAALYAEAMSSTGSQDMND